MDSAERERGKDGWRRGRERERAGEGCCRDEEIGRKQAREPERSFEGPERNEMKYKVQKDKSSRETGLSREKWRKQVRMRKTGKETDEE